MESKKDLFILKYSGGDRFERKLATRNIEKGLEAVLKAWAMLQESEKKNTILFLQEGEENEEGIFNELTAGDVFWDSDYQIYDEFGYGHKTVEEAQKDADFYAAYTGKDIYLYAADKTYIRRWYGTPEGWENCEDPIRFGNFGFYGDWEEQPANLGAYLEYALQKADD